jgi:hypothetical protein
LIVRELSQEEVATLKQGLRSSDAFTLRRSQILLASNQGQTPQQVAAQLHCSDQCVREAVHAFHAEGLACLKAKSHALIGTNRPWVALGWTGYKNYSITRHATLASKPAYRLCKDWLR